MEEFQYIYNNLRRFDMLDFHRNERIIQ